MGKRDPRVDAYIAKAPDFAKPVLSYLREVVHTACPGVEEGIKWSVPFFDYKGTLCQMASFKAHCAFGFWKGTLVMDGPKADDSAGEMGRITSIDDLPPKKELIRLVKKAAKLNDEGVKAPRVAARAPKAPAATPDDLAAALAKNKKAKAAFEDFPPSHRREYIDWITEAKSDATRQRRIEQAVEWIAEGKARNWKYARK